MLASVIMRDVSDAKMQSRYFRPTSKVRIGDPGVIEDYS